MSPSNWCHFPASFLVDKRKMQPLLLVTRYLFIYFLFILQGVLQKINITYVQSVSLPFFILTLRFPVMSLHWCCSTGTNTWFSTRKRRPACFAHVEVFLTTVKWHSLEMSKNIKIRYICDYNLNWILSCYIFLFQSLHKQPNV